MPYDVAKAHPIFDDAPCHEAIGDFLDVDGILLQVSPETLDEDIDPLPGSRFAETTRMRHLPRSTIEIRTSDSVNVVIRADSGAGQGL